MPFPSSRRLAACAQRSSLIGALALLGTIGCGESSSKAAGTAELVVARLTSSVATLTHLSFALQHPLLGDPNGTPSTGLALGARGDTLLVAAYLGDTTPDSQRILTYLEIDSRLLP